MIIQKKSPAGDTVRLEWMGRELSSDEKAFMDFNLSWINGVMSAKNSGFTIYAIQQLGDSLDACSLYLKKTMGYGKGE